MAIKTKKKDIFGHVMTFGTNSWLHKAVYYEINLARKKWLILWTIKKVALPLQPYSLSRITNDLSGKCLIIRIQILF